MELLYVDSSELVLDISIGDVFLFGFFIFVVEG